MYGYKDWLDNADDLHPRIIGISPLLVLGVASFAYVPTNVRKMRSTPLLTALAAAVLSTPLRSLAAPTATDACAKIAGKTFVPPAEALACQKSFAFNETLRQNVLTVAERVFNFYSFEDYYLDSPAPFQDSTVNIRSELARINSTHYDTDYDFNRDFYNLVNGLNDGHTCKYLYGYTSLSR